MTIIGPFAIGAALRHIYDGGATGYRGTMPYSHNAEQKGYPVGSTAGQPPAILLEKVHVSLQASPLSEAGLAIGPISLEVGRGAYHLVTGHSGSGKSRLSAVMALVRPPASGRVSILGVDNVSSISHADRAMLRRRLGYLPQNPFLPPDLSVIENVLLPLRLSGAPLVADDFADARELLLWVGLTNRDTIQTGHLSAGERRSVALARALIRRPELFIADDPSSGLDERNVWRMMGLIEQLHRQGTTVIVATNDRIVIDETNQPRIDLNSHRPHALT